MLKQFGFSQKIIATATATLVISLVLFSSMTYVQISNQITHDLDNKITQVSNATADAMSTWLRNKLQLIEALAGRIAPLDTEERIRTMSVLNAGGDFRNVYLGDESGVILIDDTNTEDLSGFDPRTRPWYQQAKAKPVPSYTAPYQDAFTKELIITAIAPVTKPSFIGVAGADIGLDHLSQTINKLDFDGLGHAFLIDGEGNILAHPDAEHVNQSLGDLFPKVTAVKAGNYELQNAQKQTRILSLKAIEGLPSINWYIAVDLDHDAAFAKLYEFRNIAIIGTLILLALSALALSSVLKLLTRPLARLRDALNDIAQGDGDLTRRLRVHSQDELGQVAQAFNTFADKIHAIIEDFKNSSVQMADMVNSMAEVAERSRHECQRQQQETDMVAAAVSQMSAAAQEIASHAQNAADAAQSADQEGQQASTVVTEAIDAIKRLANEIDDATQVITELEVQVGNISTMVDVIRGIAEQTNLLALNAAIEAARAGEQGRGFAVVADEVRTLASKTQESTEEINRLIGELQGGSAAAVKAMETSRKTGELSVTSAQKAGESLNTIADAISTISDMNVQIATASEEQTAVTEDIARNITSIADATKHVTEAAEDTDQNSKELANISSSIHQKVARFKL